MARLVDVKVDSAIAPVVDLIHGGTNSPDRLFIRDHVLLIGSEDAAAEIRRPRRRLTSPPGAIRLASDSLQSPSDTQPEGSDGFQLHLAAGELWQYVLPDRQVTTIAAALDETTLDTPTVIAAALSTGTWLHLLRAGDGTATLTVLEGEAALSSGGQTQQVRQQERSVARPGQSPSQPVSVATKLPFVIEWTEHTRPIPLQEAERAHRADRSSVDPSLALVRALLQEGQVDRAVGAARRTVRLEPNSSQAHFLLGVALTAQGVYGQATRELQVAARLDPAHREARAVLARAYLEQGRRPEEDPLVMAERERDPRFVPAMESLGRVYWRRGQERERLRRHEAARREYQAALEQEPGSVLYHLELAQVYLDRNNLPDALKHALAAVALAHHSSEAHAVLGLIYDRRANPEQAQHEYRQALSLSPANALARLGLGINSGDADVRLREISRVLTDRDGAPAPVLPDLVLPPGLPALPRSDDTGGNASVPDASLSLRVPPELFSAFLYGRLSSLAGMREVTQAMLWDPAVLSRLRKPGVTTEVAPGSGSHSSYGLGFTHSDQFSRGVLYDLSFASQQRSQNYRNGQPERRSLWWLNLAAAPTEKWHTLGQLFFHEREIALPGSTDALDPNRHSSLRDTEWDLATRYQMDPVTSFWFHAAQRRSRSRDRDSGSPGSVSLDGRGDTQLSQHGIEGRLDHRWGLNSKHATSYVLFFGRDDLNLRYRTDGADDGSESGSYLSKFERVAHTLQHDYHSRSRLTLVFGLTAERLRESSRTMDSDGGTLIPDPTNETHWLPFGHATYLLTERDLLRAIIHERRPRLLTPALQSSEAFSGSPQTSLGAYGRGQTMEISYERRFSPRRFGRLFLFHQDLDDLFLTPAVRQSLELPGFVVTRASSDGAGIRYEWQIGRFVSSYLRYTYREVTDQTQLSTQGRQLPMNPHSQAAFGLNFIDRAGTKLFAEAVWNSRMYTDVVWSDREEFDSMRRRPDTPSRLILNLRIARERTVRREWVFRVYNLLDTQTIYWPGFPTPGRTFDLQYRIRF